MFSSVPSAVIVNVRNSVGIDLKELGGQLPKCLKFAQELKFKADFHSKMTVCRHELGVHPLPDDYHQACNLYALA